jgi:hypothetical protein
MQEFREDIRNGLKEFFPLALGLYGIWDWRDATALFREMDPSKVVERLRREKRALVADAQKLLASEQGAFVEFRIAAESILAVAAPWDGLNKEATELAPLNEISADGSTVDERIEQANAMMNPALPPSSIQEFLPFARMVKKTWDSNRDGTLRNYEGRRRFSRSRCKLVVISNIARIRTILPQNWSSRLLEFASGHSRGEVCNHQQPVKQFAFYPSAH